MDQPNGRAWLSMLGYLALFTLTIVALDRWSRRPGWSQRHRLALAGGAVLTYAWHSFPWRSLDAASLPVDLVSNTVITAAAIVLPAVAARRLETR